MKYKDYFKNDNIGPIAKASFEETEIFSYKIIPLKQVEFCIYK